MSLKNATVAVLSANSRTDLDPKELAASARFPPEYYPQLQFINHIQPHGVLIAVDDQQYIVHISSNCSDHLKVPPSDLLGASVASLFDDSSFELLLATLLHWSSGDADAAHRVIKVKTKDGQAWTAIIHPSKDCVVIELEEMKSHQSLTLRDFLQATRSSVDQVESVEGLCQLIADRLAEVTKYDRMMVYRFDRTGAGEVVAEVLQPNCVDKDKFLGMSFPEMDIPRRARQLFLRNRFRIIADAKYVPSKIISKTEMGSLDMSRCTLRGVSPCHLQYLSNMEVRGTLVSVIVVDGSLWGLVCGHHYSPMYWSFDAMSACAVLCTVMSSQIGVLLERQYRSYEMKARDLQAKMLDSSTGAKTFTQLLIGGQPNVMDLIKSCGAAVLADGEVFRLGICPPDDQIFQMIGLLRNTGFRSEDAVWHTDCLINSVVSEVITSREICGMLIARMSEGSYVMWFRREVRQERKWAGGVDKEEPGVLCPRTSFNLWVDFTCNVSEPFGAEHVATARTLRSIWLLNDKLGLSNAHLSCVAEELRKMIEAVTVPVFGLDLEGRVNEWNPKSAELFGVPKEEILDSDFVSAVVDERDQHKVRCTLNRAAGGAPVSDFEYKSKPHPKREGHPSLDILLRVATRIDSSGRIVGVVGIGTDMTSHKAIMKAEIRAEETRDFLANMSHEMRTPLNGILGMLQLAQDLNCCPQKEDYLSSAIVSGEHLLSLINNVLDISKMEAGKTTFEEVEIHITSLVATAVNIVRARAAAKQIPLHVKIDQNLPRVLGDSNRIQQILLNYLSNAVKFTIRGHITIRVYAVERSRGFARTRFEVEDTGVGIKEKNFGQLFIRFSRVRDREATDPGGTGLGLAICKEMVEKWGGQVGCKSEFGSGSTFWFEIPFTTVLSHEADIFPSASPRSENMEQPSVERIRRRTLEASLRIPSTTAVQLQVLVAEDNEMNMRVIRTMLQRLGHVVHPAVNGAEAVEFFKARMSSGVVPAFNLILMDCEMPKMSGYQATEAIRAFEMEMRLPHHPIVAVTAYAMPEDREKCLAHGMDEYMTKPVMRKKLEDMITKTGLRPEQLCVSNNAVIDPTCSVTGDTQHTSTVPTTTSNATTVVEGISLQQDIIRALVVDDSPINIKVLSAMLEKRGHKVTVASDGAEALTKVEETLQANPSCKLAFDIIFMDCFMPLMTGFEAAKAIRTMEAERKLDRHYIVAVTGAAADEDQSKCLAAGMDDHISKPILQPQLAQRISTAISRLPRPPLPRVSTLAKDPLAVHCRRASQSGVGSMSRCDSLGHNHHIASIPRNASRSSQTVASAHSAPLPHLSSSHCFPPSAPSAPSPAPPTTTTTTTTTVTCPSCGTPVTVVAATSSSPGQSVSAVPLHPFGAVDGGLHDSSPPTVVVALSRKPTALPENPLARNPEASEPQPHQHLPLDEKCLSGDVDDVTALDTMSTVMMKRPVPGAAVRSSQPGVHSAVLSQRTVSRNVPGAVGAAPLAQESSSSATCSVHTTSCFPAQTVESTTTISVAMRSNCWADRASGNARASFRGRPLDDANVNQGQPERPILVSESSLQLARQPISFTRLTTWLSSRLCGR